MQSIPLKFTEGIARINLDSFEHHVVTHLFSLTARLQRLATDFRLQQINVDISRKPDGTVSLAEDKSFEKTIIKSLNETFGGNCRGEEFGISKAPVKNEFGEDVLEWVIDPIDGSANFGMGAKEGWCNGFPLYATSIALYVNGKPHIGFVCNLYTGDVFLGVEGKGAYMFTANTFIKLEGNAKIPIEEVQNKAGICLHMFNRNTSRGLARELRHVAEEKHIGSVRRRTGSTALDLCLMACGSFAVVGGEANLWDYAAAALIAKESGACVTVREIKRKGASNDLAVVLASHPGIATRMEAALDKYYPVHCTNYPSNNSSSSIQHNSPETALHSPEAEKARPKQQNQLREQEQEQQQQQQLLQQSSGQAEGQPLKRPIVCGRDLMPDEEHFIRPGTPRYPRSKSDIIDYTIKFPVSARITYVGDVTEARAAKRNAASDPNIKA